LGRAHLFDTTLVHENDAVGNLERFVLVVCHKDRRDVQLVMQAPQPSAQLLADLGVECAERLVEKQNSRLDR